MARNTSNPTFKPFDISMVRVGMYYLSLSSFPPSYSSFLFYILLFDYKFLLFDHAHITVGGPNAIVTIECWDFDKDGGHGIHTLHFLHSPLL